MVPLNDDSGLLPNSPCEGLELDGGTAESRRKISPELRKIAIIVSSQRLVVLCVSNYYELIHLMSTKKAGRDDM